jgi:hypothetical protein
MTDMSEVTTELDILTAEGKVYYSQMETAWDKLAPILLRAKELVPHGQWEKYLEDNFPLISTRTARRYMQAIKQETTPAQLSEESRKLEFKTVGPTDLISEPGRPPIRRLTEHQVIEQQLEGHPYIPREYLEKSLMRDLQELEDKINDHPRSNVLPELRGICLKVAKRAQQLADKIDSALEQEGNVTCFPSKL